MSQYQSLSIVVPATSKQGRCINQCKFCVARMVKEDYKNQMDINLPFYDLYLSDYIKRLNYARDIGVDTVMLTGNIEPQQNRNFLMMFGIMNKLLDKPFRNIEIQTTGVNIDENYLRFLRNHVGVSTISLSISSLSDTTNASYNGTPKGYEVNIIDLCQKIKKYDFNLRLSINLTDSFKHLFYNYEAKEPYDWTNVKKQLDIFFDNLRSLYQADQIIFRELYSSDTNTPQDLWILEHKLSDGYVQTLMMYIMNGRIIGYMPYGNIKYNLNGMSVVLDRDCMNKNADGFKYLILRENCKLYSQWDNPSSLVF